MPKAAETKLINNHPDTKALKEWQTKHEEERKTKILEKIKAYIKERKFSTRQSKDKSHLQG